MVLLMAKNLSNVRSGNTSLKWSHVQQVHFAGGLADHGGVGDSSDSRDPRVERYWRMPSQGPRILFFSGGSALRGVSRELKRYTWNSIHIVTPFDSGGSSAEVRRAFSMISVGDLRNRLLALSDEGSEGDPALFQLLSFRLPTEAKPEELRARIRHMVDGDDPLVEPVLDPARAVIRELLGSCAEAMPDDFELRGASIGNLVLAGGYLREQRNMASVLATLSEFMAVRGVVRPVTEEDVQLGATLADGTHRVGQHLITGKQGPPLDSAIDEIFFTRGGQRVQPTATPEVLDLIANADLIVFPMGSFFTSVLCNLLPQGVGRAIVANEAPKIYLPNTVGDPEERGLDMAGAVARIADAVRRDAGENVELSKIVGTVLCDRRDDVYQSPPNLIPLVLEGMDMIRVQLADEGADRYDAKRLAEALVSLA